VSDFRTPKVIIKSVKGEGKIIIKKMDGCNNNIYFLDLILSGASALVTWKLVETVHTSQVQKRDTRQQANCPLLQKT